MDKETIYFTAWKKYGQSSQLDMVVEECAELIQAIQKLKRGREGAYSNVLEEGVDVEIMIGQLKYMFDVSNEWNRQRNRKLYRLRKKLKKKIIYGEM